MNTPTQKSSAPLVVSVGIVAILAGALLAWALLPRAPIALATGTLLQPPRPLPSFSLVDQDAAAFTPVQLQDRWTILFFGFTHCPDICPTTLTLLAGVEKALANLPPDRRPRFALVTADAQRDTPERLKQYVRFFNPNFIAVTGQQSSVEAFALSVGAPVAIRSLGDGAYTVDHSSALFVIDPQGALRAVFNGPHRSESLVADLRTVVGA